MKQESLDRLIASYAEWKLWSPEASPAGQDRSYAKEIARAGLAPDARILEIGFGEAAFLDWARARGYACEGTEINPELVAGARKRGHEAHLGLAHEVYPSAEGIFDAVVMFDVLEHIALDDIFTLLDTLRRLLASGGKIIARFPNGASPFGRAYQHGDATHVSALTGSLMKQIGLATGFDLIGEHNAARAVGSWSGGIKSNPIVRGTAFLLRDAIQIVLSSIYFGRNMPMDPNLTVVLRKRT